ncbi:hypothetical protein [Arthrobacter castelli]|uniref:hypothetical protein n=1 Tax=Arthrobacter castelli TaxID=271431 RepID=UPI0004084D9A|nr:hypothetical protein [Arthrobacter castelli]
MQQLTEDEFDFRFTVVPDPATGSDVRPSDRSLDPDSKQVWTMVEADDNLYIISGWHYVNNIGYMVTEEPWDEETEALIYDAAGLVDDGLQG